MITIIFIFLIIANQFFKKDNFNLITSLELISYLFFFMILENFRPVSSENVSIIYLILTSILLISHLNKIIGGQNEQ